MVEVVFHVGAHKCATTALQKGLSRLSAARPGMVYVPPCRVGRAGAPAGAERSPELHDLVRLVARGQEAEVQHHGVVAGLCSLIERHRDRDRVVFSDEYILGAMPGLRWSFYPQAAIARAAIEGVARRFPTRVLLQSRETAAYLKSSYRFRVQKGMTLSYGAFLDRYDLSSVSWAGLGATLFDGAAYEGRVLPVESLSDEAELAQALRFVSPDWSLEHIPFQPNNEANGPLMRAATLVLQRADKAIDTTPNGPAAAAFDALEPDLTEVGEDAATARIEGALARLAIKAGPRAARMIWLQFLEEREPDGSLHRLLAERFAPDYSAFLKRYATSAG